MARHRGRKESSRIIVVGLLAVLALAISAFATSLVISSFYEVFFHVL